MTPLKQRLKELDPHTFELLILHLVKERYPAVNITHVDGAGGDQGLDIIQGQLDERPTIWQCKSFPNGIKESQKQQIRESLNQALRHSTPERWILCLSIDMDAKALRWFQRLASSRSSAVEINIWQATDIIHELLYRNTVREHFFPNTVLNTAELREIIAKTAELTIDELKTLTTENIDLYLQRLQQRDARFTYAVTFTRDRKPIPGSSPDELLTITTGQNTLHVYGRDHDALQESPPKGTFTLTGVGVDKFAEHIRTGAPQTFAPGEVTGFTSDFDFLLPPPHEQTGVTLSVRNNPPEGPLALRVTFGLGDHAVTYDYIPFRCTQIGTEQAAFESVASLPFIIDFVLRADNSGTLNFRDTSAGSDVHDIQRFLSAMVAAIASGTVEFYDLAKARRFLRSRLRGTLPQWVENFTVFINEAVTVADTYQVKLLKPATVTPGDIDALYRLAELARGTKMSAKEIKVDMTKVSGTASSLAQVLSGEYSYRIVTSSTNFVVFGVPVATGPIEYEVSRARITNVDDIVKWLDSAPFGSSISIVLAPVGPFAARRHSDVNALPLLQYHAIAGS